MSTLFKWVHLSDLHFQTKDEGIQTDLLRERLSSFLSETVSECNALILSGDYRYAPTGEKNPKKCSDYILSLARSLRIGNGQIIAVPGNHDLDRSIVRDCLIEGVEKRYDASAGTIDPAIKKDLMSGFTFYNSLCISIDGICCLKDSALPHSIVHLEACDVLLLNTSLAAGRDGESGRLIVGSSEINKILKEDHCKGKPIIAVGHHSLTELNREEQKNIETVFKDHGVHLYLCGHAHTPDVRVVSDNLKEIIVGCIKLDGNVDATFSVGEITNDGDVNISGYKWDLKERNWFDEPPRSKRWSQLYSPNVVIENEDDAANIVESKVDYPFSIMGYNLLAKMGMDGIKYFWGKNDKYVESITLNHRVKNNPTTVDNKTSAYTISTSFGCLLSATRNQCRFCETGTMQYGGLLRAEEIALQCIFMAEYDSNCRSYTEVKDNYREFAFMGQGEPGFNYPAIKNAILMTDYAMDKIYQKVSRYIISTCGIVDFMPSLIEDIRNGVYKNPVTVHFSLHAIGDERKELMPIDSTYNYTEFIHSCQKLYEQTKEKIGVGILMFDKYRPANGTGKTYSLTAEKLKKILNNLDSNVFRIDLCTVNDTSAGKQTHSHSHEAALKLLEVVTKAGFEGKIFTSFGDNQQAGCGMLSSSIEGMDAPGNTTIKHFNTAVRLLLEAKQNYMQMTRRSK